MFGGGALGRLLSLDEVLKMDFHDEIGALIGRVKAVRALSLPAPAKERPFKHTARWRPSTRQQAGSHQTPNL